MRLRRRAVILGIAIGLAAAAGILSLAGRDRGEPESFAVSDCDGRIERIVLHYTAEMGESVSAVYVPFLAAMPADVEVVLVCPSQDDLTDFRRRVKGLRQPLRPVVVDHPMTAWSRDRWAPLTSPDGTCVLLRPCEESGASVWEARAGDHRVAEHLANALPDTSVSHSRLAFDGGDVVADAGVAIISRRFVDRCVPERVASVEQLRAHLWRVFGRSVVVLSEGPDHHAGMLLMLAGGGRAAVADAAAGIALWDAQHRDDDPLAACGGIDRSQATIDAFDAVAERLRAAGLAVTRIPVLPAQDGRAYVTFTNGILDERDGTRIVYMPTYHFDGAEPLNAAGQAVWESLGFEVRPVDCTSVFRSGGTLRCLVHAPRRS